MPGCYPAQYKRSPPPVRGARHQVGCLLISTITRPFLPCQALFSRPLLLSFLLKDHLTYPSCYEPSLPTVIFALFLSSNRPSRTLRCQAVAVTGPDAF